MSEGGQAERSSDAEKDLSRDKDVRGRHLASWGFSYVGLVAAQLATDKPQGALGWAALLGGALLAALAGTIALDVLLTHLGRVYRKAYEWLIRPQHVRAVALPVLVLVVVTGSWLGVPRLARAVWPAACAPPFELRVLTSEQGLTAFRGAAAAFERAQAEAEGGCRPVHITVYAGPVDGVRDALVSGWSEEYLSKIGPQPDVWLPDSTLEIERVRAEMPESGTDIRMVPEGATALSPLVLGVPESAVGILGEEYREGATWRQLITRARAGGLALVRPNPTTSVGGLLHTAALYLRPDGDRDRNAIGDTERLHGVEQLLAQGASRAIEHGSILLDSDDTLLCRYREQQAEGLPIALLVSEQALVDYNRGAPLGGECSVARQPSERLIAFYPRGTFGLDHPFVRVDWTDAPDDRRKRMAEDFRRWLTGEEGQGVLLHAGLRDLDNDLGEPLSERNGVRPDVPFDRDPPDADDLDQVLETYQRVRRPSRVLLALDASGSMGNRVSSDLDDTRLDVAVRAAERALTLLSGQDEFGLWAFSTRGRGGRGQRELVPIGRADQPVDGATRAAAAARRLAGLSAGGATPLYDTIEKGVRELRDHDAGGAVNVLVVLTDGKNSAPGPTLSRLVSDIEGGDVRVFVVAVGGASCGETLSTVTGETRGQCYEADFATVEHELTGLFASLWGGGEHG